MNYRIDIQALRGIAVLLVVFYHAQLLPIENGFLGVDIFFVISGFLITSQITKHLDNNNFSFAEFYLRRAWRLLPAAYLVFVLCCLLAPWILSYSEQQEFLQQLWGAMSFSANFVLWRQTGYFEASAQLKPLLHTWSLSIEEQYYLLMPAFLAIAPTRMWLGLIALFTLISLSIYLIMFETRPSSVFYFTPTRIWELGVGSILALVLIKREYVIPNWCGSLVALAAALAATLAIFFTLPSFAATKLNLIITVLATALIIATRPAWLNRGIFVSALAKVGTISYSLYLVHWPVMAFLNNANISGESLWWPYRLVAVLGSMASAYALYYFVEARFRITDKAHSASIKPLILLSLLVLLISFGLAVLSSGAGYQTLFRANNGLSQECSSANFDSIDVCKTSDGPTTLLWGDSFAMHLAPGLKLTASEGIIQAAKLTCLPITAISFYRLPKHGRTWGQDCINFNNQVERYAINNNSIERVVIASLWEHILSSPKQLTANGNLIELKPLNIDDIANQLIAMINRIRAAGKKVIVVAPPPALEFDIANCHERMQRGQWRIDNGSGQDCRISYSAYKNRSQKVTELMSVLSTRGISVYWFDEKLCDDQHCITKLDEVILYRDKHHFSYAGSERYALKFDLAAELKSLAN